METQSSDTPEAEPSARRRRGLLLFALFVALLVFHVSVNLWWLGADNHVIRTDEEGHMGFARDYFRAMALDNPGDLFGKIIAMGDIIPTHPIHPPLLHILGGVMIMIFGYSVDVIAATNTVMFVVMLLGCYFIARRFLEPWPSLYVVFVVSFTPMIYAASRFFLTDYVSLTIVVWAIYALLRSDYFRNPGWVFIFAVLNGLGILARTPTFFYFLLPSMLVFLVGVCSVLSPGKGRFINWKMGQRLFFHAVMTLVVTIGIASPWYFRHMEDVFPYWSDKYSDKTIAAVQTPPNKRPEARAASSSKADAPKTGGAMSTVEPKTPRVKYAKFVERILRPETPWKRYPVHAINQGVFFPMFILSLFGALLALLMPRYRSFTSVILIVWIVGSWGLMTVVFKYSTARYTLQVLPALAFLSALAVMSPPKGIFRNITMSVFAVLLLFQFGNLSLHDYGPAKELFLPWQWDKAAIEKNNDRGIAIYKDRLTLGFSYSKLSAPTTINYKDKIFAAMVRHEKSHPLPGEYANYLRLRMRGMKFDEQHYWPNWPERNPFLQIPEGDAPSRKLHDIEMKKKPELLVPYLDRADYIVYFMERDRASEEAAYRRFFEARDFEVIERFEEERFGQVPARIYGVMARRQEGTEVALTKDNIAQLTLVQLYEVIHSSTFSSLSRGLQQFTEDRFQQSLADSGAPEIRLSDDITLVNLDIQEDSEPGWAIFNMLFWVSKPLAQDYRMYFRGTPPEEVVEQQLLDKHVQGSVGWDFNPVTPTSQWRVGDYTLVSHRINVAGVTYRIEFGFMTQSGKAHGSPVILEYAFP